MEAPPAFDATQTDDAPAAAAPAPVRSPPDYLLRNYWWAYVSPRAVRFFERPWLVNAILWGNYRRLCDEALAELTTGPTARTLQIACVYGELTQRLGDALAVHGGSLDVVDVLQVQIANLRRKLGARSAVRVIEASSEHLPMPDASYDQALLFFLLHEQPDAARANTLREALRVLKPGGRLVIVDYARPAWWHPLRLVMLAILSTLEPYALALWSRNLQDYMPPPWRNQATKVERFFGSMYQKIVLRR